MVEFHRWLLIIVVAALMLVCSAHAQAGASLQNISADEIVSKIKAGEPVDYQNIAVQGSLDLSRLDMPVKQAVTITNSRLGLVNFAGVSFEEPVDLRSTVFENSASFAKVKFLADSKFAGARFKGATDFRYSEFGGLATFTSAQFLNDTSFGYAQFDGDAVFLGSDFVGDVDFDSAQFSKMTSFWSAKFENVSFLDSDFAGRTNFGYTQFKSNTVFAGTRFGNDVVFRAAQFSSNATFANANFEGLSEFNEVYFKGMAIFLITKFTDNAYFTDARFDKDLILEGARIYSMQLDNATFGDGSRIRLKDADFNRFVVRWKTIKDLLIFHGAAYQALVKNYKNLEWFDDADECYYQYRWLSQAQEPWGWTKLADITAWLSCGYGVRVSYVSFWCILTILIFGLLYWAGNGMRRFEIAGVELPGNTVELKSDLQNQRTSLVDAIYFSVAMFTTSQAPVNNYPVGVYRHLAMVEGILGWFFLGLFVVVLSGVLIR